MEDPKGRFLTLDQCKPTKLGERACVFSRRTDINLGVGFIVAKDSKSKFDLSTIMPMKGFSGGAVINGTQLIGILSGEHIFRYNTDCYVSAKDEYVS